MSRAFWVCLKREFGAFFLSPIAYVIFFFFSIINAISFLMCAGAMEQGMRNVTLMQIFFQIPFFWFCIIISVPILTMRLFADEYRMGTIELLLTAPVTDWDVVLAKFFGALGFYVVLWVPTALYYSAYQCVTNGAVPVPWGPLLLCYALVLMLGMFYTAIGVFASSLTRSQAVAAFTSFALILILFFLSFLIYFTTSNNVAEIIEYFSALKHMQTFADGVFDTRVVVWYLSGTVLFLALTQRVLAVKRLKA
jgi:ABC-2 type transport system permease protein